MPANGRVRVIIEAAGLGRVQQALRGLVGEARRADRAMAASGETMARSRMRNANDLSRSMQSAERDRVRTAVAADRAIDASRIRLSTADRARLRAEERAMRDSLRARQRLQTLSTVGAVLNGVGGAALDRVNGYGGAIGIPSRDEMVGRFISNEQRVIRLGAAGGRDPAALSARVSEVARSTNVDPTAIIGALEVAQNRFSRLGDFADNIEEIARAANAAGGAEALPDWVAALGEFQRQLGTSAEDVPALLGSMVDMMDAGSIEAADVAANFAEVMGSFATLRGAGARGLSGSTEFLALAESLGAGGVEAPEAATRARAMMTSLGNSGVRTRLERVLGSDVFDRNGTMNISFGELAARMGEHSDVFGNTRGLTNVFGNGDVRARAGWESLIRAEMERNASPDSATRARTLSELMATSSDRGNQRIDTTMDALMNSTSGRAINAGINAQANFAANGEGLVAWMTQSSSVLADFTTSVPLATEAIGALSSVAASLTGTLATLNMAMGGGIFGTAAGGAAAAGAGGVGAGAAGGGLTGALAALGITLPAVGALFAQGDTSGGPTSSEGERFRNVMRNLSPEARATYSASLADSSTEAGRSFNAELGRALIDRGTTSNGGIVSLSSESIREMVTGLSRSLSTGAPADGREPGEPGRR